MKYKNVNKILPPELIEEIQKYIQGEIIYIPKKDKQIHKVPTEYRIELEKRDARIYTKHLEGMSNDQLAKNYNLAQSSIRRIIVEQRKKFENMTEKIKELLLNWDLQNKSIRQIYNTVWQIGEDYVLKLYSEPEALERNILINQHLDSLGIPVAKLPYSLFELLNSLLLLTVRVYRLWLV